MIVQKKKLENKNCNKVFQHKIYVATPNLLYSLKIPYSIVLQSPGNLFFIHKGTYHAVINMGTNIAEGANYGCDEWNRSYEALPCPYSDNDKNGVVQDKTIVKRNSRSHAPPQKQGSARFR